MLDTLDLRAMPTPIANAIVALEAASNPHEARDRLVEVFRATLRFLGGLALAARLEVGAGPGESHDDTRRLLERLRRQSLTDGEWVGLTRELLRGWKSDPRAHPLPALVDAFVGRRTKIHTGLDELLGMRKRETVAHGTTGTVREAQAIVDERLPQLVELLAGLEALFVSARVVVPLQRPADEAPQRAWLLHGPTTWRGEWRSVELAAHATPGKPVIVDPQGTVRLVLDPAVICERASPDVPEDLFFFDGRRKRSAAFVAFPSLAEVWREDVLERLGLAVEESDGDEATSKRAPFRGLASFDRRDAAFFVGREKLVEQLTNRVSSSSWVTVTGASGSGKTSLLAAGVDPALRARVEREGYRQGDDAVYAIVLFRPGDEPLQVLAMELDERLGLTLDRESPSSWARQILDWCAARRRVLVLMVDQAEELVTRCKDGDRREAFGALLAELTASVDLPVRVVFSLRVDFMARVATIRSLADRYQHVTQVVTTPAREDLVRILVEPAARFGVRWEEGLAEEIARTVEDEDSALPLLSYVASRLWDERGESDVLTREAYEALGGVKGALAAHAEKVVARWTEAQRRVARAMLLRLVTADWTRDVVPRAELEEIGGEATDAILGTLERERLVVARTEAREGEGERQVVELAHESLLEHWHQLREWRDEDVEAELHHARLRGATREWLARGRAVHALWGREKLAEHAAVRARRGDALVLTADETAFVQVSDRAVRRRRRVAIGTTAVVTSVVAAFAVFAVVQWRAAVASRDEATRRGSMIEARGLIAASLGSREPAKAAALMAAVESIGREQWDYAVQQGAISLILQPARISLRHEGRVLSVDYGPDGRTVATGSMDGTAVIWDAATGSRVATLQHDDHVLLVAYAADGSLLTTSAGGVARLWDPRGHLLKTVRVADTTTVYDTAVTAADNSPDGSFAAVGAADGSVAVWRTSDSLTLEPQRFRVQGGVSCLTVSNSAIMVATEDGHIVLQSLSEAWRSPPVALEGKPGVRYCGTDADSQHMWTLTRTGELDFWPIPRRDYRRQPPTTSGVIWVSENAEKALVRQAEGSVALEETALLSDPHSVATLGSPLAFDDDVSCVTELPGAIAVAGRGIGLRIYDSASGRELWSDSAMHVRDCVLRASPLGDKILIGLQDDGAAIVETSQVVGAVAYANSDSECLWSAISSSDEATGFVVGDSCGSVFYLDASNELQLNRLHRYESAVSQVQHAPGGRMFVVLLANGSAILWDMDPTPRTIAVFEEVHALAFDRRGEEAAFVSDETILRTRVSDGKTFTHQALGTTRVTAISYARDGQSIIAGTGEGELLLIKRGDPSLRTIGELRATGESVGEVEAIFPYRRSDTLMAVATDRLHALVDLHSGVVGVSAFGSDDDFVELSPDGESVLSASEGAVRVWNPGESLPRHEFAFPDRIPPWAASYFSDGRRVILCSADGSVSVVDLQSFSPIASLQGGDYARVAASMRTQLAVAITGPRHIRMVSWPLRRLSARTNLRVCRDTLSVVETESAEALFEGADSMWADSADCERARRQSLQSFVSP